MSGTDFFGNCLPRMRGDRPSSGRRVGGLRRFTPHARGSTIHLPLQAGPVGVYPACAGIDLQYFRQFPVFLSLPRMRGDRPTIRRLGDIPRRFTPHARGSTAQWQQKPLSRRVYPACAGIDRTWRALV